jgi:hypothetical protein
MNAHTSQKLVSNVPALFSPGETESADVGPQSLSKTMSIFELDQSLCLLMDSAEEAATENNGEIPQALEQALLDYCEAFGQKVDNLANYIRSQEFEVTSAAAEIERLARRRATAQNRAERLKGLLRFFMESRSTRSLKGRLNTISLRKNNQDSLVLTDPTKLGTEFWRISIVVNAAEWEDALSYLPEDHCLRTRFDNQGPARRELDNARVRAAIGAGTAIDGAELRKGYHIRLT